MIPTLLCGGAGSRLWPISRELHPKPFIRLPDGNSLIQKAFLRGAQLSHVTEILTVTNRDLFFKLTEDIEEVNTAHLPLSFMLEPVARNTAAAITLAACYVAKTYGNDMLMLVLPADHLIDDHPAFTRAVDAAITLANKGKIVTFGIKPHSPETGYGYLDMNEENIRFVEKPCLSQAKTYLASGGFLWNSGMFCFSAGSLLHEMATWCTDIYKGAEACLAASPQKKEKGTVQIYLDVDTFKQIPENSIDYAVMEKTQALAVVPCQIGWQDIGSWNGLERLVEADANGNRVEGHALLHNVTNCYIQSQSHLVAAVGIENLAIIDTPDAVLIANKAHAQEVKDLYQQLKDQNHETHKIHRTVYRPWGTYTVLEEGPGFKIKRIVVKPGASLSLQMHRYRSEHWVVVSGIAKVTNGDQILLVNINESTYIPAGHQHRLENPGETALVIIEVQSGDYLGEDDIVRYDDCYGRTLANA